jgi:acetyl-CoA synthetase
MWFHGDLAYMDSEGFWFLVGRSDDVLKVGGTLKSLWPCTATVGHRFAISPINNSLEIFSYNFLGKRCGPAEFEAAAMATAKVKEAAAVGVTDKIKGQAVVLYVVPHSVEMTGGPSNEREQLRHLIMKRIVSQMGKVFEPRDILFCDQLPKTRSGKVMRRVIAYLYETERIASMNNAQDYSPGNSPARAALKTVVLGDTSTMENPEALDAIRRAY